MGGAGEISADDIYDVFEQLTDPTEPLSTSEIANPLDCSRRTAYSKLEELAEEGWLRTKTVGANARVWWLSTDWDESAVANATNRGVPELTADHVLELEFHSEQLARAFLEAGDDDVQITVDGIVPLGDGGHLQYWTITGIPPKSYVETVTEWATVEDVRLLSTVDDSFRVEVQTTSESLFSAFDSFEGHTKTGYLDDGSLKVVGEFPATVEVAGVVDAVQTVYADLDLTAQRLVYTPRLFRTIAKDRLSDRQWTAFQLAYFCGYFDRPRASTGDDLADRMGISRQTFHHHLREAERTVFQILLEGDDVRSPLARDDTNESDQ
ncbi:MAG: bacterio-opsin activator domain-containing protein [Halodesulfurarchaeum sp.]